MADAGVPASVPALALTGRFARFGRQTAPYELVELFVRTQDRLRPRQDCNAGRASPTVIDPCGSIGAMGGTGGPTRIDHGRRAGGSDGDACVLPGELVDVAVDVTLVRGDGRALAVGALGCRRTPWAAAAPRGLPPHPVGCRRTLCKGCGSGTGGAGPAAGCGRSAFGGPVHRYEGRVTGGRARGSAGVGDVQASAPRQLVSLITPTDRSREPFVHHLARIHPRTSLRLVAGPGSFGPQVVAGMARAAGELGGPLARRRSSGTPVALGPVGRSSEPDNPAVQAAAAAVIAVHCARGRRFGSDMHWRPRPARAARRSTAGSRSTPRPAPRSGTGWPLVR